MYKIDQFLNFNFDPLNIFEQKLNREFFRKMVFVTRIMFIMDLPTNEAIFNSIRIDLHMFLFEVFVDYILETFSRNVFSWKLNSKHPFGKC